MKKLFAIVFILMPLVSHGQVAHLVGCRQANGEIEYVKGADASVCNKNIAQPPDVYSCPRGGQKPEYRNNGDVTGCKKVDFPEITPVPEPRVSSQRNAHYLSCDTEMDTHARTPEHFDYYVDFDSGTVNYQKAYISDSTILFKSTNSDGTIITTQISRISGAISLRADNIGVLVTGTCRKAETRKF